MKSLVAIALLLAAVLAWGLRSWLVDSENGFHRSHETSRSGVLREDDGCSLPELEPLGEARRAPAPEPQAEAARTVTNMSRQTPAEAACVDDDWQLAKEGIRGDFELNENDSETFREFMALVDIDVLLNGEVARISFDLQMSDDQIIGQLFDAQRLPGDSLSETQRADGIRALADCRTRIDSLTDNALRFYQEALLQYWQNEMYIRWKVREGPDEDACRAARKRIAGSYSFEYISSFGDWRAGVFFDSAQFPVFESVLRDLADAKVDCLRSVSRAMGIDPLF